MRPFTFLLLLLIACGDSCYDTYHTNFMKRCGEMCAASGVKEMDSRKKICECNPTPCE